MLFNWWRDLESNYLDEGSYCQISLINKLKFSLLIKSCALPNWHLICLNSIPVGYINYRNYSSCDNSVEISIRLSRENWGKKVAEEATLIYVEMLRNLLSIDYIWLEVLKSNYKAYKVYQSIGFQDIVNLNEKGNTIKMSKRVQIVYNSDPICYNY